MSRSFWLTVFLLLPLAGTAQPLLPSEVVSSGTAYFIFTEPGAPTVKISVVGEGTRSGIYVLQDGTTLTELVALAGGTPASTETELQIVRAFVRVLRVQGGARVPVYEATVEALVREPAAHPDLQDGDVVEVDLEYEEVDQPFTLQEGLDVASRIASIASVVILLYSGFR